MIVDKEDLVDEDEIEEEKEKKNLAIEMVKRESQQKIVVRSNKSISSSVNMDDLYKPNKQYHVTFISPDYNFDEKGDTGYS